MGTASAVPLKLLGHPGPQRTILSEHKHVVRHKDAVGVPGRRYVQYANAVMMLGVGLIPQQVLGLQVLHA